METYRYKVQRRKYKVGSTKNFIRNLSKHLLTMLFFSLCILCENVIAQTEKTVSSTISNVTVFRTQAQVLRVAKTDLNDGITYLVFERLSPYINQNSIEVKADPRLTLLSVSSRNNYLRKEDKNDQIASLEDSLELVNDSLASFKADKETIIHQKDLMLTNRNTGSNQNGVKTDELEDLMDLYHKKLNQFKTDWLRLTAIEKKFNSVKHRIENQLNELKAGLTEISHEIVLSVAAESHISNATIELSYLVGNVSWQPFFDVRIKDSKSPVQFFVKANITQGTGEDWKNVNLKLTTANPSEGGTKPELLTSWLRFYQPETLKEIKVMSAPAFRKERAENDAAGEDLKAVSSYKWQTNQTTINTEFLVLLPYSIPSDNRAHQVELTSENYEARFSYGCVPKLDKDAFVTAKLQANDLINQVSGEANIYFDGTFTGKTFINGTALDTLTLSLGRDKRIRVERKKLKDLNSKSFFGNTKKENATYEISIRNTRKEPIQIEVEDQIPVSTDKEIEVKLLDNTGASFNPETGKLTWVLSLLPEQTQKISFSFEVKYPKDKQISGY